MKLFELYADLSLDASGFDSGVKKATKMGSNLAGTLKGSIGGAAQFVGKQVSATTVMLGNLMTDMARKGAEVGKQVFTTGIDYNRQMETYVTNFTTMLDGSSAAAEKLTADLEDMAASTPFAMADLADATQVLMQFGQDSETVMGTLESLGDIAMGDKNKLQSLTLAFAQASSSGKLMGQDLMQMINAGFNPLQTIVDKTGASMADLKEFMSNGKASAVLKKQMQEAQKEVARMGDQASVGAKMLVKMAEDGAISAELLGQIFDIETSPGGKFYKAMENASKTFNGMVSTLEDDTAALMGKVMEPAFDFMTDTLLPKAIAVVGELDEAYDLGGLTGMANKATEILGETLGTWGTVAFDAGSGVLAEVLSGLTGDTVNKEEIKKFFTGVASDGSAALNAIVTTGSGLLAGIWEGLSGDTENETNIVQKVSGLWTEGTTSLTALIDAGGNLFGAIYESLTKNQASADNVGKFIGETFSGASVIVTGLKDSAVDTLDWISTNADSVSAALGPMLAMFAGLKIKANPLSAVVASIVTLTTDWTEFEKTSPQLVSTFETLSGLDFSDFVSGVDAAKTFLSDFTTWLSENRTVTELILGVGSGVAFATGHPVVGAGLFGIVSSMTKEDAENEIKPLEFKSEEAKEAFDNYYPKTFAEEDIPGSGGMKWGLSDDERQYFEMVEQLYGDMPMIPSLAVEAQPLETPTIMPLESYMETLKKSIDNDTEQNQELSSAINEMNSMMASMQAAIDNMNASASQLANKQLIVNLDGRLVSGGILPYINPMMVALEP